VGEVLFVVVELLEEGGSEVEEAVLFAATEGLWGEEIVKGKIC
jgi:hypothetical protein